MTLLVYKDRVSEYAADISNGAITLLGVSAANLRTFAEAFADGDLLTYCIEHRTSNQWEIGVGTYGSGVLNRTTVLVNSAGTTTPIVFVSGLVDVRNEYIAEKLLSQDAATNRTTVPDLLTVIGQLRVLAGGMAVFSPTPNEGQVILWHGAGPSGGTGRAILNLCALPSASGNPSDDSFESALSAVKGISFFPDNEVRSVPAGKVEQDGTLRWDEPVRMTALPTSASGLPTGALWNNGGVVHIV